MELNSTSYQYEQIRIRAGERIISTNLRYKKEFEPIRPVFDEVERLLRGLNHYVDGEIVRAFIVLFGLAGRGTRTSSLVHEYSDFDQRRIRCPYT
jgi:hypothetical protein